jgi:hypothetical protein
MTSTQHILHEEGAPPPDSRCAICGSENHTTAEHPEPDTEASPIQRTQGVSASLEHALEGVPRKAFRGEPSRDLEGSDLLAQS